MSDSRSLSGNTSRLKQTWCFGSHRSGQVGYLWYQQNWGEYKTKILSSFILEKLRDKYDWLHNNERDIPRWWMGDALGGWMRSRATEITNNHPFAHPEDRKAQRSWKSPLERPKPKPSMPLHAVQLCISQKHNESRFLSIELLHICRLPAEENVNAFRKTKVRNEGHDRGGVD